MGDLTYEDRMRSGRTEVADRPKTMLARLWRPVSALCAACSINIDNLAGDGRII